MSKEIVLSNNESQSVSDLLSYARRWCSEHQLAVGIGEMAVGAALISWGVHNGAIEMGAQVVGTKDGGTNTSSLIGAVGGASIGATAGTMIGSIGIAGMGGAIGIPVALLAGGAAAVLSGFGYSFGDLIHNFTTQAVDIGSVLSQGSLLLVGLALITDGARRCMRDSNVKIALSYFKDGVIYLADVVVEIVARTLKELDGMALGVGAIGAGVGAAAGGAVAASSVTILGSHALGGVAMSLGVVSAPVWPVIAGVVGGAYVTYQAIKYWRKK